ncbi:MAG: hypothetical protein JXP34_23840 [Planctomycetes bacterium]|nr:hypothetical protein [Planctomycetota bacterium]
MIIAAAIAAAGAGIEIKGEIALDGWVRDGRWCEIALRCRNDGPAFAGEVRIRRGVRFDPLSAADAFVRRIELPSGADRIYRLPLFDPPYAEALHVEGLPGGMISVPLDLRALDGGTALLACSDGAARILPRVEGKPIAIVAVRELPSDGRALEPADAVWLLPSDIIGASPAQIDALYEYALRGGALILSLAGGGAALSLPADHPLGPAGGADLASQGLARAADGIWARPLGSGKVILVEPEPAAAFASVETLAGLGQDGGARRGENPWAVLAGRSRFAGEWRLRIGLFILIVLAFALVVGVAEPALIRRIGRPRLAWLTYPLILCGFSVAVWLYARHIRAGELQVARTLVVDWDGRTGRFLARGVIEIHADRTRAYDLEAAGTRGRIRPVSGDFMSPGEPIEIRLEGESERLRAMLHLDTVRAFYVEWQGESEERPAGPPPGGIDLPGARITTSSCEVRPSGGG